MVERPVVRYHDEVFTTWNKPPGVPCFPPHDDPAGDCVLRRLLEAEPQRAVTPWPEGFDGGIAHRLDVLTSGALLVADDLNALVRVRALFSEGRLKKTYRFVAAKSVPWDTNHCDRPLAHDRRKKNRMVVQRGANTPHRGRWYPASTQFRRLQGDLWQAVITTGVMHQIRAHAAFVGIPLLGDRRYGGGTGGFRLHHLGVEAAGDIRSDQVPLPVWARPSDD